ncbi:hypothetical protein KVV02_002172 [Mortierella alpina]|uniref:Cation-transporting P-type ATPase N-terminal domain-containing protein n=1 Tax=Mortierella alpina TaxID=64518 RepID=A0A9P8A7G7_MORAP|nr:hypothetical protein KVV02_002172 [Mortierella alpina]
MASNPDVAAVKEQTEGQSTPAGTKASSVTIDVNVATIDIEDLYNKDKFDMSTMETDNIFQLLKTGENGLTTAEAESRVAKFGYNRLEQKEINPIMQFLSFMWNPLSWVMEAAAIVAIVLSNGGGEAPDWPDFTEDQIAQMHADVDEFARRGLRALAVAMEEVPEGQKDSAGTGFTLIGLLPIYDPPRHDTKETIDRAQALGVQVKMITGDQLAIAKETGRRLGMEIFTSAIAYGIYLTASTLVFFAVAVHTDFFYNMGLDHFDSIDPNHWKLHSIIYLQVSTLSQALIFVTRSQGFSFIERPSAILAFAFVFAQIVATLIAVYANWGFTQIEGCGWGWAAAVWVWNIIWYFPMDLIKFALQRLFKPTTKSIQEKQQELDLARTRSTRSYYSSHFDRYTNQPRNFSRKNSVGNPLTSDGKSLGVSSHEMRRFSTIQAAQVSSVLSNAAGPSQ